MQTLIKFIALFTALLIGYTLSAQPGRGLVRQPPRINGAARAAANAGINAARIHANSNSVFGTGNTHPNYTKKEEPKKEEINKEELKEGDIKKNKGKKQKK
jgi:hypothetical protein